MLLNRNFGNKRKGQSGIALIEFAICVPVVLLTTWITIEFGRALLQYNTLTQAIRDSARYVAQNTGATGQAIVQDGDPHNNGMTLETGAKNLVVYGYKSPGQGATPLLPGLSPQDVTVTANGLDITVTVSYNYVPFFFGGIPQLFPHSIGEITMLRAAIIMRALQI